LHELPSLAQAEWEFLMQGLVSLAEPLLWELEGRIRRLLPEAATPPFTCPFLDPGTGSCVIYEYRPVACRTYGFYVERDKGLYCEGIEARVGRGEMDDVVWGNHGAIEAGLADLGERIGAADWFRDRLPELVRDTRSQGPRPESSPAAAPSTGG
jgi:Fe-S-cluster containining protein